MMDKTLKNIFIIFSAPKCSGLPFLKLPGPLMFAEIGNMFLHTSTSV